MSKVRSTVEYGAMGVGATLGLWIILCFFPTIMVSLSITNTFYDWDESKLWDNTIKDHILYDSKIHANADPHDVLIQCDNAVFAAACVSFCIIALIIGAIQGGLAANIRHTWFIIVPWFVLSIFPTFCWLGWLFGPSLPFPGVNWMPW